MPDQEVAIRSREEIEGAIQSFTDDDWARLKMVAKSYAFSRPIEPDDLLQEALTRSLLNRKCPVDVDVIKFLYGVMRSIAHGAVEKAESRVSEILVADPDERQAMLLNYADPAPGIAQNAADIRHALLALFEDHPKARLMVEGIMDDMSAGELQEMLEIDKTAYNSMRKLIRRRIDTAYPEGWKP